MLEAKWLKGQYRHSSLVTSDSDSACLSYDPDSDSACLSHDTDSDSACLSYDPDSGSALSQLWHRLG